MLSALIVPLNCHPGSRRSNPVCITLAETIVGGIVENPFSSSHSTINYLLFKWAATWKSKSPVPLMFSLAYS